MFHVRSNVLILISTLLNCCVYFYFMMSTNRYGSLKITWNIWNDSGIKLIQPVDAQHSARWFILVQYVVCICFYLYQVQAVSNVKMEHTTCVHTFNMVLCWTTLHLVLPLHLQPAEQTQWLSLE